MKYRRNSEERNPPHTKHEALLLFDDEGKRRSRKGSRFKYGDPLAGVK